MTAVANPFWIEEYTRKAASADPMVQSGRSAQTDLVGFLQALRRAVALLKLERDHWLLDVGCGNGLFDLVLSGCCHRVVAIERVPALAEIARRNLAACTNVELIFTDGAALAHHEARFHRVLIWEAIQLMTPNETRELFRTIADRLQPGARIVIGSVPDLRQRDAFLARYFADLEQAAHLSPGAKAEITARQNHAHWYDPRVLASWWAELGGAPEVCALPDHSGKADHRFDLVVNFGAAQCA